jgi:hypothetical protein
VCHGRFTVRGRAQGTNPRRSADHLPTNNAQPKDHDHGHEEEAQEEESGEEGQGVVIAPDADLVRDRIVFRFARCPRGVSPKRLDESPAALLFGPPR